MVDGPPLTTKSQMSMSWWPQIFAFRNEEPGARSQKPGAYSKPFVRMEKGELPQAGVVVETHNLLPPHGNDKLSKKFCKLLKITH